MPIWITFLVSVYSSLNDNRQLGMSRVPANAQGTIPLKTAIFHKLLTEVEDGSERTDDRRHSWRKLCLLLHSYTTTFLSVFPSRTDNLLNLSVCVSTCSFLPHMALI